MFRATGRFCGCARLPLANRFLPSRAPGRIPGGPLHSSYCQSTILPSATAPCAFITMAEPYGSQANSSSRIHCTRTGRPGYGAREQRRVERDVVLAIAAITAGSLGEDAPDRRRFDVQGFG